MKLIFKLQGRQFAPITGVPVAVVTDKGHLHAQSANEAKKVPEGKTVSKESILINARQ
jgi:hypothetical protein